MSKNTGKSLVIVESPAKAKTIGKILGTAFHIESSVGHIRDLPIKGIGVNTRKNFEPTYEILSGKQKVVEKLIKLAEESSKVYLATDPDREGEAIAWHLSCILNVPAKQMSRVKFHEITEQAVKQAFAEAGPIDDSRVAAQQARRILDRLVGYKVSPLIQRSIGGRSAGRVQSVAVRLICEREDEIELFEPQEYWTFAGKFSKGQQTFQAQLATWNGLRISTPDKAGKDNNLLVSSSVQADEISSALKPRQQMKVASLNVRPIAKNPGAPFITSTLQRAAASAFGYGVKKTMQVAQGLYEGVELGQTGSPVGLITYMRTDSARISEKAQDECAEFIENTYGKSFLPNQRKQYSKKKSAQDAHEAIRPTYVDKTPESIRSFLTGEQYKIYKLIWERFVASQMAPAQIQRTTVELADQSGRAMFRASSNKTIFPGFMAAFQSTEMEGDVLAPEDGDEETLEKLPELTKGDSVELTDFLSDQHFTEPPPRFNEASLVKTLEELGIGRPSTYAAIISTIQERKYVQRTESKTLIPTKLGRDVNRVLLEHFGEIFETKFTAGMESKLDEIERSELNWQEMLREFYDPFKSILKTATVRIANQQIPTDIDCPKCNAKLTIKSGRFGPFLGCSTYPKCNYTGKLDTDGSPAPEPRPSEVNCPKCNEHMNITRGRYGDYLLCPNDNCKHKMPIVKSTGIKCPKENCKGVIVEKKSRFGKLFFGCSEWSNTGCDAVFWARPIQEHCPSCNSLLTYKFLKRGDKVACPVKTCGYSRDATAADYPSDKSQAQTTEPMELSPDSAEAA